MSNVELENSESCLLLCHTLITDLMICSYFQHQNGDYFSQYITEDIEDYVERKRYAGVHGNHLEIQALSEMYNRPIHIYCYSLGK